MEASLQIVETRARRAYEWARLRRALFGTTPVALLVGLAALFTTRFLHTGLIGLVLLIVAVAALWWGRGLQRALVPGVLAGTLPLVTALCATRLGHALMGPACMPLCYLASFTGGVGAGLIVGAWGFQKSTRLSVVGMAAGFGLLTGSMGSSCIGRWGVAVLAAGFVLALGAQWLRGVARRGTVA